MVYTIIQKKRVEIKKLFILVFKEKKKKGTQKQGNAHT